MADYLVTDTQLTNIADAIRLKTGGTEPITFPDGFVSDIGDITTLAEDTTTGTLPLSGVTINAKSAVSISGISIYNAKAIKSISCYGLPDGVEFLYELVSYSSSMLIDYYLYNNSESTKYIPQGSLTVITKYYK